LGSIEGTKDSSFSNPSSLLQGEEGGKKNGTRASKIGATREDTFQNSFNQTFFSMVRRRQKRRKNGARGDVNV